MTIFEHVRNEIIALGYPNVYIGSYNDDYDDIVSIKYIEPVKGSDPVFGNSGATTAIRNLDIEIMVRNTDFDDAFNCIEAIRTYFAAYKYQTITIISKSDIITKGNDERNRSIIYTQFSIKIVGSSTLS